MKLSDEQIQDLLRVGNPTDEECRLIRMGWDAAMREWAAMSVPEGWKLVPIEPTIHMCIQGDNARENIDDCTRTPAIYRAMLEAAPEAKP